MSCRVASSNPVQAFAQEDAKQTSRAIEVADLVHNAAVKAFKILSAPFVVSFYLLAVPVQMITSFLIGAVSTGKSVKKTSLFGLTFFARSLASAIGWEPKGGAPYTKRTEISKGLHVSRLPFKKDVDKIAKELKIDPPSGEEKMSKEAFTQKIQNSSISEKMKQQLIEKLEKQPIEGQIQGVIIDVTEPEETTYVLGLGKPATKDDWNKKGILYFNFPAKDMKALDVQMNLDLAELAQIARTNGAGALVHCAKGIGRSLTIGLTAHALYGDNNDINLAPAVSTAIKETKTKRAYGLNPSQELVVYESKLLRLLAHVERKQTVGGDTIEKIKNALKEKSNLETLANDMIGISTDHLNLKACLKELENAKRNIDEGLDDDLYLPSAMIP